MAEPEPIAVLLPLPVEGPYDYLPGDGPPPRPGAFVEVPFGPRVVQGVVWDTAPERRVPRARLKAVTGLLDAPPMPPGLRRLIEHVAAETLAPKGAVLRLAMSVPSALSPPPTKIGFVAAPDAPEAKLTPARRRALAASDLGVPQTAAELARRAGVGSSVVKALVGAGLLLPRPLPEEPGPPPPDPDRAAPNLSLAQGEAADAAAERVRAGGFGVLLLDGVPGAGKTEVYFEAVAEALRADRRALVLLPEIALSAQWLDRFAARFGVVPAVWHSELSAVQRRRTWRRIAEGRERVAVGARSALFLPLDGLGLVVVDEEHDQSFKQEDGVIYHARDMAIARARFEDCPILLASATPALESALRAGAVAGVDGGPAAYERLILPERHRNAPPPGIDLVDLKAFPPPRGGWLSPPLRKAMAATLEAGEQALLFLNRRGFAPLTLCRACGHRMQCPSCAAWLVEHRMRRRLQCHHCGHTRHLPEHCPACGALESLTAVGPGVERLGEEVRALFPEARLGLMTSDVLRGPAEAADLVHAMQDHAIDVLIGTQIVAKGHHFPDLTLVGVVDGDLGLSGGDLRAAERSFQLLYQVSGRAGRATRPGRVLVQTYLPDHPVMRSLARGDREGFYRSELEERKQAGMPPWGRLAALIVSGADRDRVQDAARRLARAAPEVHGVRVLGPAPAPLAVLRGRHRQRLLVKAAPRVDLTTCLRGWLKGFRPGPGVRLQVDVDPYSFL